jgi:hypothetical protein
MSIFLAHVELVSLNRMSTFFLIAIVAQHLRLRQSLDNVLAPLGEAKAKATLSNTDASWVDPSSMCRSIIPIG